MVHSFKGKALLWILVLVLMCSGQAVFGADGGKPSQWAEAEISASIAQKLVPAQLQKNYQGNITRSQYVLLALKVFETTGKEIIIKDTKPFTDAVNHPYQEEIAKAYNAGIVKGDGKGNFMPDNYITREEIASLIVNLLKQITPAKDFTLKNQYPYTDRNKISDWAAYYIDFCYENKILTGYNGNVMDPKGNATIEQSIALLYRLANRENLLVSKYGTVILFDKTEPSPQTVNQFVENYGKDTFNVIKELSENQKNGIMSLWERSATLSIGDSTISLNNLDFEKNLFAIVNDIHDEQFIFAYQQLLRTYQNSEEGITLFLQYVDKMKANEVLDVYLEMGSNTVLSIRSISDNPSPASYLIGYIQRKS